MAEKTGIAWTDSTWSPILGCTPAGPGCPNCYARRDVWRMAHNPNEKIAAPRRGLVEKTPAGELRWTGKVSLLPEQLEVPLSWREPRRIFPANQADLFHEGVPAEFLDEMFAVMFLAERHTFQILTKRPERARRYFLEDPPLRWAMIEGNAQRIWHKRTGEDPSMWLAVHELPNVLIGYSAATQKDLDRGLPDLLALGVDHRFAGLFLSLEPLLERIDLHKGEAFAHGTGPIAGQCVDIDGASWHGPKDPPCTHCGHRMPRVEWIIVGGESGAGARPCDVRWIRDIVEACRSMSTACFVKQLGAMPVVDAAAWRGLAARGPVPFIRPGAPEGFERLALTGKGADPAEWPEDLRVQQFPEGR